MPRATLGRDLLAYTHLWEREPRGGYGFIERVPCRPFGLTASGKRMKIAALHKNGTAIVRYVKPSKLSRRGE